MPGEPVWPLYRRRTALDDEGKFRIVTRQSIRNSPLAIRKVKKRPPYWDRSIVSFPPRLSISEVVGKMKAISAKVIFEEFPEAKREMYGGEFWEDGYFARTVGDEVTTKVIRRYIKYHDEEETSPNQLDLFDQ
jgi:REP element-mobilizing transposase RayT